MNDFYNGSTVTRFTLARAAAMQAIFQAIADGFDKMPTEEQLKYGTATAIVGAGSANVYTGAHPFTLTAGYIANMRVQVQIPVTNTGASTINLDSQGAVTIKQVDGSDVSAGDLPAGGIADMAYNDSAGEFRLIGATPGVVSGAASYASAAAASALAASSSASSASSSASSASSAQTAAEAAQTAAEAAAAGVADVINASDFSGATATNLNSAAATKTYIDNQVAAVPGITLNTTEMLSGTAHESTGIASGTKRVTFGVEGASLDGSGDILLQLGDSGGIENTSYLSYTSLISGTSVGGSSNPTSGFNVTTTSLPATMVVSGVITLTRINSSTHTWAIDGRLMRTDSVGHFIFSGVKTLSAELTQVRWTTTAGTASFDAGTITRLDEK